MLTNTTRARVIQLWFAAVALVIVAAAAFGTRLTFGTGMLLVLSLVPPLIVFALWPGAVSPTAGDVLRGTDHRE